MNQLGPVVVHSNGTIQYANEAFATLIRAESPLSVTDTSLHSLVAASDWDELTTQFEGLIENDATVALQLTLQRVDGSTCEGIAVSSAIHWEGKRQLQTSFIELSATDHSFMRDIKESALHEAPLGITIADATRDDEPLIYVNDGFVELTGYPWEEAIGRNCRFLQGKQTREEPVSELRVAIAAAESTTVELRNYRKDGSLFWNRVTIVPIRDENDELRHFLGFQEDISDRKVYEREKSLFEQYATTSEQIMVVTDTDGTIEYVNPAFERITGYSSDEAIGKTPNILHSGEQDEAFYRELWETLSAGETWEEELTNRTKAGEQYRVRVTITPVTDETGRITQFLAIERDISTERLTDEVLSVLDRVLRHNVRSAITVIDGYAEFLEANVADPAQKTAAQSIQTHSETLYDLSNKITTIRRLLDGTKESATLEIGSLERIVERVRSAHPAATLSLRIETDEKRPLSNGAVLQVALETALETAIDNIDKGQPHVEITVQETPSVGLIAIEVTDNGPPFPEREWEIIKSGRETPLEHTDGIDLWILYWSVVALGGTVELSTNEPRGNVLTLEVPLVADSPDVTE